MQCLRLITQAPSVQATEKRSQKLLVSRKAFLHLPEVFNLLNYASVFRFSPHFQDGIQLVPVTANNLRTEADNV